MRYQPMLPSLRLPNSGCIDQSFSRRVSFARVLPFLIFLAVRISQSAMASDAATWDYNSSAGMPDAWNGVDIRVDPEMKTPDKQRVLEVHALHGSEELSWPSHINFWTRMTRYHNPKAADVVFWAKGEPGTELHVRIVNECHAKISAVGQIPMLGGWQKVEFREDFRQPLGMRWISLPRIMLGKVQAGQKFWLGPVSVRVIEGESK